MDTRIIYTDPRLDELMFELEVRDTERFLVLKRYDEVLREIKMESYLGTSDFAAGYFEALAEAARQETEKVPAQA